MDMNILGHTFPSLTRMYLICKVLKLLWVDLRRCYCRCGSWECLEESPRRRTAFLPGRPVKTCRWRWDEMTGVCFSHSTSDDGVTGWVYYSTMTLTYVGSFALISQRPWLLLGDTSWWWVVSDGSGLDMVKLGGWRRF